MKAKDLVSYVARAHGEGWGYVLGAQGEVYTPELAHRWAARKQGGKDYAYFTQTCSRWYGRKVVDCSGLIIEAIRSGQPGYQDQTADTLYTRCTRKGALPTMPEQPGLCVWRRGHIGVYIGQRRVVEARGAAHGVVDTALHSRGWTNWGMLRDIDYNREQSATDGISSMVIKRLLRLQAPMQRGGDVLWLQEELNSAGHSCGNLDGIFGSNTRSSVYAYQQCNGLNTDGIAGRNTVTSLGGVFLP